VIAGDPWIFLYIGALALEKVMRSLPVHQRMELLGKKTILAYADDMVIWCSREEIITKPADLIAAAKTMGLDLIVGNYTFQAVTDFKYLGTIINNENNMHNEIKLRISAAYKGYFVLGKLLNQIYFL